MADPISSRKLPRVADEKGDTVHAVGKAAASTAAGLVAFASGGLAGALAAGGLQAVVEIFFIDRWKQRQEAWSNELAAAVEEIRAQKNVSEEELVSTLTNDDDFIATLQQATTYAIRSHQHEKLVALRNAVVNAALPGAPEIDLQSMFLRLVDELSPTHLRILWVYNDPLAAVDAVGGLMSLSRRVTQVDRSTILDAALPDLRARAVTNVFSQQWSMKAC
jgi:hypothetical protein